MGNNKLKQNGQKESFHTTLENLLEGCQIIGFSIHNRRPMEEPLGNKYMQRWQGIEDNERFRIIEHCTEERVSPHLENEFVFPDGTWNI